MRHACLAVLLTLALTLLAACGGETPPASDPSPTASSSPAPDATGEPGNAADAGSDARPARPAADGDDSGIASLDDLSRLPGGEALADAARQPGEDPGIGDPADTAAPSADDRAARGRELMADFMAATQELAAAGNDPAKREAAMAHMTSAQEAMSRETIRQQSQARAAALTDLPAEWQQVRRTEKDGPEAELLVQLGDIDNLGFGWPKDFDPFSGKSTPVHRYPYAPEDDDPDGTDRIMVVSGYTGRAPRTDGYTQKTQRPHNDPRPLVLEFDPSGIAVKTVALQLFVDDFQSKAMGSHYRVWLDGREAGDVATTLNALEQTGPIGKLVTLQLLPEYLDLVADGRLEIRVDDPDRNAGDGFAFDFVRLLVNPKGYRYTGSVRGIAVDTAAGKPLPGVLVSAANVVQALSDDKGMFLLEGVPAGLVVTTGSKPGYDADSEAADLLDGRVVDIVLELSPSKGDSASLAEQLEREGKADLYGIYFDTAKATLKPESEATLQQVLGVLTADPALRLVIAGHTDSEGGDDYNQDLSERRAASVVAWLAAHGVDAARLQAEGLGESRPVADNGSEAGRALNRRVEVRVAD